MANQRLKTKEFVSCWMDGKLKRDTLKEAKRNGFKDGTEFITCQFRKYLDQPFRRPASIE